MMGEGEMLLPEEKPEEKAPEAAPSEILLKLLDDAQNEKARLLSIIESQQRTIERQQMTIESLTELTKKVDVRRGDNATCAAVG